MKKIPLTMGKYALVDDEDYEELSKYKWHYHDAGYATRSIYLGKRDGKYKYKKIFMHRQILNNPKQTDHANGDGLDNRRSNLRVCDYTDNMRNRRKSANKSSKFKGVLWDKRAGKWRSRIGLAKDKHIGYFNDEKEAAIAYNEAAKEHFGEFARLNVT